MIFVQALEQVRSIAKFAYLKGLTPRTRRLGLALTTCRALRHNFGAPTVTFKKALGFSFQHTTHFLDERIECVRLRDDRALFIGRPFHAL